MRIEGYPLESLAQQKSTLKRECSSRIIPSNVYIDTPIPTDSRDEPNPPPYYTYVRNSSTRPMVYLYSGGYVELLVSSMYICTMFNHSDLSISTCRISQCPCMPFKKQQCKYAVRTITIHCCGLFDWMYS